MYKTGAVSWSKERIAFQIKAMLEHAEVSIDEAEDLSRSNILAKTDSDSELIQSYIALLSSKWDRSDLPGDIRRLAENVQGIAQLMKLTPEQIGNALDAERTRGRGPLTTNLSPFAAVLQSVIAEFPKEFTKGVTSTKARWRQPVLIPAEIELPAGLDRTRCENAIFVDKR
jgi:hypothetical protein